MPALPVRGSEGEIVKWVGTADSLDEGVSAGPGVVVRQTARLNSLVDAIRQLPGGDPVVEGGRPVGSDATGPPVGLRIRISVLGTLSVLVGGRPLTKLSLGSQRLVAYLALHDRTMSRASVAATMWPQAPDQRAGASLRSALSRMDPLIRQAIVASSTGLRLADTVAVDLRESQALARRLLQQGARPTDADVSWAAVAALSVELLPDWYDDWVVGESEGWRQMRVHALEELVRRLNAAGRLAEAAAAARAAIRVEPLRESAHAALVRVHLAAGNQYDALAAFEGYRTLLRRELCLEPTPLLSELVSALRRP